MDLNGCQRKSRKEDVVGVWRVPYHGASEDFLRAIVDTKEDACIIWPYCTNEKGYGLATIGGKQRGAHNWICRLVHGDPPEGRKHAAHKCGDPICVNPNHIRWATHAENMNDKYIHGTMNHGERNGKTTITEEDVIFIRRAPPNLTALSQKYGMTPCAISRIRSAKTWAHVPERVVRPGGIWRNIQCRNGHLYDEPNTRINDKGYRQCRACDRDMARKVRERKRASSISD